MESKSINKKISEANQDLLRELSEHGIPKERLRFDSLLHLPKEVIYRLSYQGLVAENPISMMDFRSLHWKLNPTSISGQQFVLFLQNMASELKALTPFELAKLFVFTFMTNMSESIEWVRYTIFHDSTTESNSDMRFDLGLIWLLWLTDPTNPKAPHNIKGQGFFQDLDPVSIWAYWTRQLTSPFFIDDASYRKNVVSPGYIYDLRSASSFVPPTGNYRETIRLLLHEATLLRESSVPNNAFVEINFPPFVALVITEINTDFVIVEALDADSKVLPIYLYPSSLTWVIPNTGVGPKEDIASFEEIATVVVAIAASALRDFWVIEDRQSIIGPPRVGRIAGSKCNVKQIIYLPRIRYVGGRNMEDILNGSFQINSRAAHWRSAHFRNLGPGQSASKKQQVLAAAHGQCPPDGMTWVRATSVVGVEVEQVYRSRSVSKTLFDIIPSKGKVLAELSWLDFERYCGVWLKENGFDSVVRKPVDRGVDITAFKTKSDSFEEWSIQCKHWSVKVGPEVIRELAGAKQLHNADRAMLITSSAFTSGAISTAAEFGIELVDGDRLLNKVAIQ